MRDRVACGIGVASQPDLWPNSSETAPLTSNLPPSAAKRSWPCVTTDVDFNRAMSTDREADNPCAPRYHCDRQLRRTSPPLTPVAKPFCNRPNIDFIPVKIDRTKRDYPFFLLILFLPSFFTIFLSLYISFFLFILFTYSLFPMFSLLLLFVLFFLSLLARYSSRGGCKMIFRNEICNRV